MSGVFFLFGLTGNLVGQGKFREKQPAICLPFPVMALFCRFFYIVTPEFVFFMVLQGFLF